MVMVEISIKCNYKQVVLILARNLAHKKFVWSYSLLKKLDSEISVEYVTSVQVG
jgi:hypothetical protein